MASLDTTPDNVDITHYAGDTLTIKITAPFSMVNGKDWLAQVRSSKSSAQVDSTFIVTKPVVDGDSAFLVLPAAETTRLVANAQTRRVVRDGVALLMAQYKGVWDCQISGTGGTDPVTTLAQGALTIELDVSRAP